MLTLLHVIVRETPLSLAIYNQAGDVVRVMLEESGPVDLNIVCHERSDGLFTPLVSDLPAASLCKFRCFSKMQPS